MTKPSFLLKNCTAIFAAFLLNIFVCWTAHGTSLDISGNVSFQPSMDENYVILRADRLDNYTFGGVSGTIRLELWAFSEPFNGSNFGYKLASFQLGELAGGSYFYNINTGLIPFVKPPPGEWYFALMAREFTGFGSDGFVTRDYVNFAPPVRVAGGALLGDVDISGLTSWKIVGSTVELQAESIKNICRLGSTGTLRLDVWATKTKYDGSGIFGYRFGSVTLNPLGAGYAYNNFRQTVNFNKPPDGYYYVTMTVSEYGDGEFRILDHVSYQALQTFGNPPPPLPGVPTSLSATKQTLTSGIRLTWVKSAHAATYEVYRSTSNAASTSSMIASGITGTAYLDAAAQVGKTYYYWVKAKNVTGKSAFSMGDYGIRNGAAPLISTQPKSVNRLLEQSATFAVMVTGTAPFQYQWRKDGINLPGETKSSLTLTNLQQSDSGLYSVYVSNNYGNITSANARLGVYDASSLQPLYWQSTDRRVALWYMDGTNFVLSMTVKNNQPLPLGWNIRGYGDFNGDEKTDFILQHEDGRLAVWFMNGANLLSSAHLRKTISAWKVVGVAHLNEDSELDILFQHTDGRMAVWYMKGIDYVDSSALFDSKPVGLGLHFAGSADFNEDGHIDFVWHHKDGRVFVWLMNGIEYSSSVLLRNGLKTPAGTQFGAILDLNNDGNVDFIWQGSDRKINSWLMQETEFSKSVWLNGGKPAAHGWQMIGPR